MDIGSGLTLWASKDLLTKILGPTAEYFGNGLKNFTEKRVDNFHNILNKAEQKLAKNAAGSVPPQVLSIIANEGSYYEDELFAEYFGGVLASSKTELGRDDRGKTFAKLTTILSTYQLRAHYIFYFLLKKASTNTDINPNQADQLAKVRLYIPYDSFLNSFNFNEGEKIMLDSIIGNIFFGLQKEKLITDNFATGAMGHLEKIHPRLKGCIPPGGGVIFTPTPVGLEYFLWVHGKGQKPLKYFFDEQFKPEIISGFEKMPEPIILS